MQKIRIGIFALCMMLNAIHANAMEYDQEHTMISSWYTLTPDVITHIAAICDSNSRNQLMHVSKELSYLASKQNKEILYRNPLNISKKDTIYYLITGSLQNDLRLLDNLLNHNVNPYTSGMYTTQASSLTEPITKNIIQHLSNSYHIETISLSDHPSRYVLAVYKDIEDPLSCFLAVYHDDLIKKHYPPSAIDPSDWLLIATSNGYEEVIRFLITCDTIKINKRNADGNNALHIATMHEYEKEIKFLLTCDTIKINKKNTAGNNALHIATLNNYINIVKLLLAYPGININKIETLESLTAFQIAVYYGYLEIVKLLLAYDETQLNKEIRGTRALHCAAHKGYIHCVQYLLTYPNIEVNAQTHNGYTALYIATHAGHIDTIKALLKHPSIKVNAQNHRGYTALHIATNAGHINSIKALLGHPNINVNAKTKSGKTALYIAQRKWKKIDLALYREIRILLLIAGAEL